MQSFVANVTGRAERMIVNGKEYLKVPVSMIVPGVLAGSKGPLYYPRERVARNASEWNGFPVTLGHPSHPITNAPMSASDDGVVARVGMGVLRNSRYESGKLRADAWLDGERTKKLAPNVYEAALNGRMVEVSTGLFTQEVERSGTHNGRSYTHEVVDYKPDHLAILVDQRGACSVQDGCGMNVHNAAETITVNNACPCGGTCRACVANAAAMPMGSSKPAKATPAVAAKSADAVAIKTDYAAASAPAASPEVVENDDEDNDEDGDGDVTDNDKCPCGGECKSCQTKNANPEGCNQYKECGSGGGDSNHEVKVAASLAPFGKEGSQSRKAWEASTKAVEHKGADDKLSYKHGQAAAAHYKAAKELASKGDHEGAAAHSTAGDAHWDARSSLPKFSIYKDKPTRNIGDGYGDPLTGEPQPRCPVKQTFQPKGFKGKGKGEVHVAAKAGMADKGNIVEDEEAAMLTDNANPEGINQYSHISGSVEKSSKEARSKTSDARDAMMHIGENQRAAQQHQGVVGGYAQSAVKATTHEAAAEAHDKAAAAHDRAASSGQFSMRARNANADAAAAHREAAHAHRNFTENQSTDRDASGQLNEGEPMKRPEMIQHLTTNCDCYKGKMGLGVLNSMSDEMLSDLINNYAAVELAKRHLGDATMATNAMPAALKKAMDEKKGDKGKDDPDEDDEDDDESPTKNAQPKTAADWLRSAPRPIRTLVENALANEREQKDRLIETLVANVSDAGAKASLTKTYLNLPVKVLQAQVNAMPTSNSEGEFDLSDMGAIFSGASLSGEGRGMTSNRVGGNGEVVLEEPVNARN